MRLNTSILILLVAACDSSGGGGGDDGSGPPDGGGPGPGADASGLVDTTTPFPIDGGAQAAAPDTYKGLPIGLVDNGAPTVSAVRGVIGVVCIGMSNATQECSDFVAKIDAGAFAGEIAPEVRVVDCAVGGHAIEKWNDPAYDDVLWNACVANKIGQRGIAPDQIRVVYHKAADQLTKTPSGAVKPPYPDPGSDFFTFRENLSTFAQRLAQKMPSVQAVYTSSRSYGGFADRADRGEPLSYEEGHALNSWLAEHSAVGTVWYGWGPYLWAPECGVGENGSGTCYVRADYQGDGVHPDQGARDKISGLIHARLSLEAWYAP